MQLAGLKIIPITKLVFSSMEKSYIRKLGSTEPKQALVLMAIFSNNDNK